jgi:hypothetical protein
MQQACWRLAVLQWEGFAFIFTMLQFLTIN